MGGIVMTHKVGRHERMYVKDNPDMKVYPIDCVPSRRSKSAWTNGVKAYQRQTDTSSEVCIGWFHPPRTRNKNHHRYSPQARRIVPRKARLVGMVHDEEE